MGLFKKIAGFFGLAKDEDQQHRDGDAAPPPFSVPYAAAATASAHHLPRRGFSVPVQVPVERGPPPPLLVFCPSGDGGVQFDTVLELNAIFPTCDLCVCGFQFKSESLDMCTYLLTDQVDNDKGLRWYTRRLRIDEDGDLADEFLDEVPPETSRSVEALESPAPRFEVKCSTKPAKVRNLELLPNGKIQHLVEHQGRLEWL
ncbi:hypothetical protein SASPL_104099 [Salvia splendens]|uniref:Uncharacterized protein n=1 Tax=Salvia splendens TaxID=180675 RepID=A0A8X9A863_SALSN|nr:hypothetical protein SASPL_104099 [Salvia splendens]